MIAITPIEPVYRGKWAKKHENKSIHTLKRNYCAAVKFNNIELADTLLNRIGERETELLNRGFILDITV